MVSYDSSPEPHSNWSGVPIITIDDWDRLYNAAMNGDDFALGYITSLNSKYQCPTEFRTAGIARLIQGYTGIGKHCPDAMKAYKARVAAVKRKTDPATPSPTTGLPTSATLATSTLWNPLPEGVDFTDYYISYSPLGHCLALPALQPHEFFEDTTNLVILHKLSVVTGLPPLSQSGQWVRVSDSNGFAREPNAAELAGEPATPDLTNVKALRWVSELSPFQHCRDVTT